MEQVIKTLALLLILSGILVWLGYSLGVIYLATQGWKRYTWKSFKWPFFYAKWEKVGKTKRILATRDTFLQAWKAESKLQQWR